LLADLAGTDFGLSTTLLTVDIPSRWFTGLISGYLYSGIFDNKYNGPITRNR
jgi:hypothetical protein